MLVKTRIGPSKIHGIGIFAAQFIKKGTPTWKFQPGFDLKLNQRQLKKLSEPALACWHHYAYPIGGGYEVLCSDDARFYNHSKTPNTKINETLDLEVASRNIREGEEITSDYSTFVADGRYGGNWPKKKSVKSPKARKPVKKSKAYR